MRNGADERPSTWAEYVTAVRSATGLGDTEMARRLGVDPSTIWRWRKGRQKSPESPEVVLRFAELFALDLDEVLAAAGLRPGVEPPAEPTREPDAEMDLILSAPVDEDIRVEMVRRLLDLRERDKARRMEDIRWMLDRRRRDA